MTATLNPMTFHAGDEPIAGYVLEEPIGRGGFGEVWRCRAPGGFPKAIKFVAAREGDEQTQRELRSLERMRNVRHPFLLTIERFELLKSSSPDGALAIVTELADGCLKTRFDAYREDGHAGIERDELVRLLSEAADGLDYLHREFDLQHLDIKPGNLLTVSGHVKVGDFGLLKDLRDVNASIVGGLTPVYAPPELFDGRPSRHSDQYSLAVMFQELLTGTRPFAGRTIAQLASQHVHSTPNLESLPPRDRVVLARALEKSPKRRYGSCAELMRCLASSDPIEVTASHPADAETRYHPARGVDANLDEAAAGPAGPAGSAPDRNGVGDVALVVAIGDSGIRTADELLTRWQRQRRGGDRTIDPERICVLAIDTDVEPINAITRTFRDIGDNDSIAIHTPLKSAAEYRQAVAGKLASISRRWIYNVPKSRETESLRPIGRLAMVDHGPEVVSSIHSVVASAAESVRQLRERRQDNDVSGGPATMRVFVVGSIAGGTCGGMYIDLVHQLRWTLDDAGVADAAIVSLLSMPPIRPDIAGRMECHNVQATLREIEHFLDAGNGYPGDAGATFSAVSAARTPLTEVYLVAGDGVGPLMRRSIDVMVDYIWLASCGGGEPLTRMRMSDGDGHRQSVRCVGLMPIGKADAMTREAMVPPAVGGVLRAWLGKPSTAAPAGGPLAKRLAARCGLNRSHIDRVIEDMDPGSPGLVDLAMSITTEFSRLISVNLRDRRCNLSSALAALNICLLRCNAWLDELPQPPADDPGGPESASRVRQKHADRCTVMQMLIDQLTVLTERLERLAALVATATVAHDRTSTHERTSTRRGLIGGVNRRDDSMIDEIIETVVQQSTSALIVRPLNDLNSNLNSDRLVELVIDAVTRALEDRVIDRADATLEELSVATSVDRLLMKSDPSDKSDTSETQQFAAISTDTGPTGGSTDQCIALAAPSLSEFGGLKRFGLIVGSQNQRRRLEATVREIYDGPMGVAVVPGCPAYVVSDVQQMRLKEILARLAVLSGDSKIVRRLASRVDVDFDSD